MPSASQIPQDFHVPILQAIEPLFDSVRFVGANGHFLCRIQEFHSSICQAFSLNPHFWLLWRRAVLLNRFYSLRSRLVELFHMRRFAVSRFRHSFRHCCRSFSENLLRIFSESLILRVVTNLLCKCSSLHLLHKFRSPCGAFIPYSSGALLAICLLICIDFVICFNLPKIFFLPIF